MSDVRQRLVDRTRFVFAVPSTDAALAVLCFLGAAIGVVALGVSAAGAAAGLCVVTLPGVVATVWTGSIDRARDGSFDAARSALLALASGAVVTTFVLAAVAFRAVLGGGTAVLVDATLIAAAGTFAFRLLVLVAVSGPPLVRRVRAALVQPAATVAAMLVVAALAGERLVSGAALAITVLAALLYGGVVVGLVALVDYPFIREWGISGFEFLHLFLEYVAERATEIESIFASLGRETDVPVSVLAFRDRDGAEKARVVVPLAHPGPFPGVGGGTLPYRLDEAGDGLVFAPHGLAGHGHNPATQADVDALVGAADAAVSEAVFEGTATPPTRARVGDATVRGQRFGNAGLFVTTFAPDATDDVHRPVGEDAAAAAGVPVPLVTDAHNSRPTDAVDEGVTAPGSARAEDLVHGVERAGRALCDPVEGLRVGVAEDPTPHGPEDGIGGLGVRVLATEVEGVRAVYVLIDGNNLVPGLRETIRERVREATGVAHLAVSTTDTHAVNHLDASNYVGRSFDGDAFADLAAEVSADAVADLEPVAAGAASVSAPVTVLGEEPIDEIAAFTDRVLPVCGWFVLLAALFSTGVSAALFWLAGTR